MMLDECWFQASLKLEHRHSFHNHEAYFATVMNRTKGLETEIVSCCVELFHKLHLYFIGFLQELKAIYDRDILPKCGKPTPSFYCMKGQLA